MIEHLREHVDSRLRNNRVEIEIRSRRARRYSRERMRLQPSRCRRGRCNSRNDGSYKSPPYLIVCERAYASEITAEREVQFIGEVVNHRSYRVYGYNFAV